jgi:hypothetical protein
MKLLTSLTAFTTVALLLAGCASSGYKQGNKAAATIQSAADGVATLPGLINQTLTTLNALVESPQADLRPQFKALQSNISALESAAKAVASDRRQLGEDTKKFLADWDAELGQIQNQDIKARSQTRKDQVLQQLENVKRSYSEFDQAFRPFMADLQDVRKYLSVDLTRNGLAAIKEPVAKAANDSAPLKESTFKLAADFKALGGAMSSVAPQSAK